MKHELVCYSCSQCYYKATTNPNLKRHVEAINELVCYSCKLSQFNVSNKKRLGNEETQTNNKQVHQNRFCFCMSRNHVYIHNYVNFEVECTVVHMCSFIIFFILNFPHVFTKSVVQLIMEIGDWEFACLLFCLVYFFQVF